MPDRLSHIRDHQGRHLLSAPHRAEPSYHLLLLACLAGTLLLANLATRLQIYSGPTPVGWRIDEPDARLTVETLQLPESSYTASGVPITTFGEEEEEEEVVEGDSEDIEVMEEQFAETAPSVAAVPLKRMVLAFSEEMPAIQGGLGAYYINIDYPRAAIDAGIQGRLVLDFTVEPDGTPTDISILTSLHPLCDSAAVRALRKTVFMPGRQGGKAVPVKMRLPVTFRLVDPGALQEIDP